MPCESCPLNGRKKVPPEIRRTRVILVGESPGLQEAQFGKPFVGRSGQLLDKIFSTFGFSRQDFSITNTVLCFPGAGDSKVSQRILEEARENCKERLVRDIQQSGAELVVFLGGLAARTFFNFRDISTQINRVFKLPTGQYGLIAYHPAYILRNPSEIHSLLETFSIVKEFLETSSLPKEPEITTITLTDRERILALLERIAIENVVAVDLETTGLDIFEDDILTINVSFGNWTGYVIPVPDALGLFPDFWIRVRDAFAQRTGKWTVLHNAKFDMKFLKMVGVDIPLPIFDTLQVFHLLDENSTPSLKHLAARYLRVFDYTEDVRETFGKKKIELNDSNRGAFYRYAGIDAAVTWHLAEVLTKEILKDKELWAVYINIIMPALPIFRDAEIHGVKIDTDYLRQYKETLEKEIQDIVDSLKRTPQVHMVMRILEQQEIEKLRKRYEKLKKKTKTFDEYIATYLKVPEFNPASPQHLRLLLFDVMGLKPLVVGKTGPSTNEATLQHYSGNPIVQKLLEFREKQKLLSAFVEGILDDIKKDGRVHTTYKLHGTVTGRLSSKNPNLQQIPRNHPIKKAFVAEGDDVLVEIDYSQIEFRVWIALSGDENARKLIEAGKDIHRLVASKVFNKPEEEITKEERSTAKGVVFGVMYGRGAKSVAEQFGMTEEEAKRVIETFFSMFPQARKWLEEQQQLAIKCGYVKSFYGRKRRLPFAQQTEFEEDRATALRQAVNAPIQSSASDTTLYTIVRLHQKGILDKYNARFIMTVHDSILFYVPEKNLNAFCRELHQEATELPTQMFGLRIDAEIKAGKNWLEMEEIPINVF